ncbi:hypothetical protein [Streptomyces halobius]|uniref:Uncharacterized protein n=1 Tax=Streptomyces halobius TaxID=2879846 RepID=A0ABY4MBU1_9ACTN|nr:hypothetical protein [Streptomyces halobius]UQA94787.1 hypothetical protein K9S39_25620 [Streptomyces halobius]
MPHWIARLFESLLRLLLPAPGRHRAVAATALPIAEPRAAASAGRLIRVPMVRGEDTVMVRPYLVAYEREQAARRRAEVAA